jgi:hypothetical protein
MFEKISPVEEVFSAAWQQVRAGRSIESVVARYPDHAAELEPMLRLAAAVQAVPPPALSTQALDRIQGRAQAAASRPKVTRARTLNFGRLAQLFSTPRRAASVLALLVIVAGAGVAAAMLMNKPQVGERTPVETYSGVIKEIAATQWLVGDTQVIIEPTTEIHGKPVVGAEITCLAVALQPGDRVRALEVWVRSGPQTPTTVPTEPSGASSVPAMALAP